MFRKIAILCIAGTLSISVIGEQDERRTFVESLFTGVEQYEWLNRLATVFPTRTIQRSKQAFVFPKGEAMTLPETYTFNGQTRSSATYLAETDTSALLVIHRGKILYESYWLTGGESVHWMSFSVGKSFLSSLIGIAIEEAQIKSVADPITAYVPELKDSAYAGVSIKDILQMSSGARWNEDYSDPNSDIMRFGKVWASGDSLDNFTASLVREHPPGTVNYYNSIDTQALAMLLVSATGLTLSEYIEQKLWLPLGMENNGYWVTDDEGMEMAAGGLQMTARDYAKFGQLYLQKGRWRGKQVVPADWVQDSITPDAPHLLAEAHPEYPLSYGYQWWVLPGEQREFAALGIYNQVIYINPAQQLVIVKLSANSQYGLTNTEESYREFESFELFRAIGKALPTQ